MKKIITIIILLILIGTALFYLIFQSRGLNFTGYTIAEAENKNSFYSFTKAICNKTNYCQDYEIECEGSKVISITPTGNAVQFSEDWEDPRDEKTREELC